MFFRTSVFFVFLSAQVFGADALSLNEKMRLGAFLAYSTTGLEEDSTPSGPLKVGDICPDCNGTKRIGDGTIERVCDRCAGTGVVQPNDPEIGSMESSLDELWEKAERSKEFDPAADIINQSTIRHAGEILENAIKDAHEENDAKEEKQSQEENKELKKEPEVVFDPLDITELENRLWTWEDKSNGQVTLAEMRRHLIEVHNVDPASVNKMSDSEMRSLHNLLHDSEVRVQSKSSAKSCPSGGCPSGGCPSGSCPSGSSRSSSSRSRGFFRRR
ncbi:MAG: hypothetical protein HOK57_00455 [Planctomycetaceae bacterium]|jgi:hypothetical protein|nr:hypothetical protein [Planctomycetaceae bacterium]